MIRLTEFFNGPDSSCQKLSSENLLRLDFRYALFQTKMKRVPAKIVASIAGSAGYAEASSAW